MEVLRRHQWPGNVRELENAIERAAVLATGSMIGPELIPEHVRRSPAVAAPQFTLPPDGISFKDVVADFEKRLIETSLESAGGVQKRAAELLHIKPTTLNEMIKRHDIHPKRRRAGADDSDAGDPAGRPLLRGEVALLPAALGATEVTPQQDAEFLDIYLPSTVAIASSWLCAMTTPLPEAKPSALMTTGGVSVRT